MEEPQRPRSAREVVCLREVRAEILSLGGAILLAICFVVTMVGIAAATSVTQTTAQRVLAILLMIGSWVYLYGSLSERLSLEDHCVVFRSVLTRRLEIPLTDLDEMLLVHQGFNLERGIESIEFRRAGHEDRDRLSLGPCWQRNKLESFLHSVEEALQDESLLEEVR